MLVIISTTVAHSLRCFCGSLKRHRSYAFSAFRLSVLSTLQAISKLYIDSQIGSSFVVV